MEIEQKIEMNILPESASVKVKTPKRILHFSDGTLEEYSDDDEEPKTDVASNEASAVDPKTLTWVPWISYMMWAAGTSTVSACDYVGESLAYMFGITTPKYYFEIEEFKRREAVKKEQEESRVGWCDPPNDDAKLVTKEQRTTTAVTPISLASV